METRKPGVLENDPHEAMLYDPRSIAITENGPSRSVVRHSGRGHEVQHPRSEAAGTADDLREIARTRGVDRDPKSCRTVERSRVVMCTAAIADASFAAMREKLALEPLATAHAPGPAFGKSRCLDGAAPERAWVTALPWLANSHYRYLLIVLDGAGGACIETEHGYG